ncbi:hypothetical protein L916_07451 [Phytophthora nicotianae]|uniref:Uncharacterized protein n=1 Tax=Phytophthora nicotianae TaxID=4792 RepID=W2J597_PHYNI|nr:hypothetical protein L916_07451 [Phytophthora nicotianae]
MWVRRTEKVIPSVTTFRRGRPMRIRLTNVSERSAYVPAFDRLAVLVLIGDLPRGVGYVRLDSNKYKDWQVLAYENCRDRRLFKRECELYGQWLATQPPSVERRAYPTPVGVMKRSPEDALDVSADRLACAGRWEKILEQRERDEGRLDSGVTSKDAFEIRFYGNSSDGGSASDSDDSDANEESAGRPQELQGIKKVMNTSAWAQSVSGAEGDASSSVAGETKTVSDVKCRDSGSSASYFATSEREGTTTGREEVHAAL